MIMPLSEYRASRARGSGYRSNPRPAFRGSFRRATFMQFSPGTVGARQLSSKNGITRYNFRVTDDESSGLGRHKDMVTGR